MEFRTQKDLNARIREQAEKAAYEKRMQEQQQPYGRGPAMYNNGYNNQPPQNQLHLTEDSMGRIPGEVGYRPTTTGRPIPQHNGNAGYYNNPPQQQQYYNAPAPAPQQQQYYNNPPQQQQYYNTPAKPVSGALGYSNESVNKSGIDESIPWYMQQQNTNPIQLPTQTAPLAPAPAQTQFANVSTPATKKNGKFELIVNHFLEYEQGAKINNLHFEDGTAIVMYWVDQVANFRGANIQPVALDTDIENQHNSIRELAKAYMLLLKFNTGNTAIPVGQHFGLSDDQIVEFYASTLIKLYDEGKIRFCTKDAMVAFKLGIANSAYSFKEDADPASCIPVAIEYTKPKAVKPKSKPMLFTHMEEKVEEKVEEKSVVEKVVEQPEPAPAKPMFALTPDMQITIGFVEIQLDVNLPYIIPLYDEYCEMLNTHAMDRVEPASTVYVEPVVEQPKPEVKPEPTQAPTEGVNMMNNQKATPVTITYGATYSQPVVQVETREERKAKQVEKRRILEAKKEEVEPVKPKPVLEDLGTPLQSQRRLMDEAIRKVRMEAESEVVKPESGVPMKTVEQPKIKVVNKRFMKDMLAKKASMPQSNHWPVKKPWQGDDGSNGIPNRNNNKVCAATMIRDRSFGKGKT